MATDSGLRDRSPPHAGGGGWVRCRVGTQPIDIPRIDPTSGIGARHKTRVNQMRTETAQTPLRPRRADCGAVDSAFAWSLYRETEERSICAETPHSFSIVDRAAAMPGRDKPSAPSGAKSATPNRLSSPPGGPGGVCAPHQRPLEPPGVLDIAASAIPPAT